MISRVLKICTLMSLFVFVFLLFGGIQAESLKPTDMVRVRSFETAEEAKVYCQAYIKAREDALKKLGSKIEDVKSTISFGDESTVSRVSNEKGTYYSFLARKGSDAVIIDKASSLKEIKKLLKDFEQAQKK